MDLLCFGAGVNVELLRAPFEESVAGAATCGERCGSGGEVMGSDLASDWVSWPATMSNIT